MKLQNRLSSNDDYLLRYYQAQVMLAWNRQRNQLQHKLRQFGLCSRIRLMTGTAF